MFLLTLPLHSGDSVGAILRITFLLKLKPGICGAPMTLAPLLSEIIFLASLSLLPCTELIHHLPKRSRQISNPRGLWVAICFSPVSLCPGVCGFEITISPGAKKPCEIHPPTQHYCAHL